MKDEKILVKKTDYFMLLMNALCHARDTDEAQVIANGYMEDQSDGVKKEFCEHLDKYALLWAELGGEEKN